jgi:hypothetical protein
MILPAGATDPIPTQLQLLAQGDRVNERASLFFLVIDLASALQAPRNPSESERGTDQFYIDDPEAEICLPEEEGDADPLDEELVGPVCLIAPSDSKAPAQTHSGR